MSLTAQTIRTIFRTAAVCVLIVATANTALTQDSGPAEPTPGGTIRGVVTYADTGRPVRYVNVGLMRNADGAWQAHGVTDARGQFVLKNVPAGRYLVYVDAAGILMPASYQRNMGSVSSQLRLNEGRDLFTEVVVAGTDTIDVKVQAVRGGVITGRVVTEDDQPVPDADVKLLKRQNDTWVPHVSWRGTSNRVQLKTDVNGVYRIAGLESGEYIVRVTEPNISDDRTAYQDDAYTNGSMMVTYHPSATSVREARAVSVVEGSEASGIDIRMPDRIPRRISGTATFGPNEEPAGWVEVLVERRDEPAFMGMVDGIARTDHEGKWEVRGIPAGDYFVRFSGAARIGSIEQGYSIDLAPKYVPVSVGDADVMVDTKVAPAAIVFGKVKFEGPPPEAYYDVHAGVVLAGDSSERPWNIAGLRSNRSYRNSYVSQNGDFKIRSVAAGRYWFVVSGFQPDRYYVKSVTRKGADLSQKPFKLDEGAEFGDITVTLATDLATIEGQLNSDDKTTTRQRDVVVMLAPANDATRRFSPGVVTTQPDAQGRFVFACGPGEYFVAVFTRAQREKLTTPVAEDYFRKDNKKFVRVKVKAGEKLKGLTVPIEVD